MSRGENYKSVYDRWVRFNTTGEGKDSHRVAEYSYSGDAFFSTGNAWQRFVIGNDTPFILSKNSNHDIGMVGNAKHLDFVRIYMPCIGVFSRFPNDRMSGAELWERMRYILSCHLLELTREIIPSERPDRLAAGGHSNVSPIYVAGSKEWYGKQIGNHYSRYEWLQKAVAPHWPDLPTFHRDEAIELMQRKVTKYNSHDESAKRQRSKARRLANKVLCDD